MLFLAEAEQDARAPKRSRVSLGVEARRVAEFLFIVAEDRSVKIDVTGDANVQADSALVQRAIVNLVSNAVRYAAASSTVRVTVTPGTGQATLTVANQGSPIPGAQLDRIFERFVRLDPGRARSEGGSGLGLAIVRSIMKAHDGNAHATSDDAGLTVFTMVFPDTPCDCAI